jgi:hypothetical protein
MRPTAVPDGAFCDFASPKSPIFGFPAVVRKMFEGFRSRWMMACLCANFRPSSTDATILTDCSGVSGGSCFIRTLSGSPSTYSFTMYGISPSWPTS